MADLGAIGIRRHVASPYKLVVSGQGTWRRSAFASIWASSAMWRGGRSVRVVPWWVNDTRPLLSIPINGTISGTLEREGVPLTDGFVALYYRATGVLVTRQAVGPSGAFSFTGLDPTDYYVVVGYDNAVPPAAYNAKLFDFVQPVSS